jgi:hypothetical protein
MHALSTADVAESKMNAAYSLHYQPVPRAFERTRRLGRRRRLGVALSLAAIAATSLVIWFGIVAVALKLAA